MADKKMGPVSERRQNISAEDRQKALETALGQIEKQFGRGAVMKLGQDSTLNVEAIPTGSLSLDIALGIGGVPRGRIIEIYGPESSGKTTVALHVVAQAQKMGGEAVFIDVEHALDPCLRAGARGGHRFAARLPAGYWRAGARDRGGARAFGRDRRGRRRLGGRDGHQGGDRRGDGRQPRRPAGPPP